AGAGPAACNVANTASVPSSTGITRFMTPPQQPPQELIRVILAYFAAAAAHDCAMVVTEVTLTRLVGVALMNRPLTMTVSSFLQGLVTSKTAITRYSFLH